MASHNLVLTDEMLAKITSKGIDLTAAITPAEPPKMQSVKTKAGKPTVTHTATPAASVPAMSASVDKSKAYKSLVPKVHKLIAQLAAIDGKSTGVPSFAKFDGLTFGVLMGTLAGLVPDNFADLSRDDKGEIFKAITALQDRMKANGDLVISPRKGYVMFYVPGQNDTAKKPASAVMSATDRLKALGLL